MEQIFFLGDLQQIERRYRAGCRVLLENMEKVIGET
jgi:hypothetical protein